MELLSLGDHGNGNFHAFWTNGKLGSLTRRRVLGKPFPPLFIHTRKIVFVAQDECGANHLVKSAAGCLEDGPDVPETLPCLCLDRLALYLSCYGVEGTLTGHEDESARSHCLTISGQ